MHIFIFALTLDLIQKSALLPLYALFGDPIDGCSDTQMKRGDSTPFIQPILHLEPLLLQIHISYNHPTLTAPLLLLAPPIPNFHLTKPSAAQHTIPNHPPMRPLCM